MMEPVQACPQFLALPKSNICMRCKQENSQHQLGVFANQLQAKQQQVTAGAWRVIGNPTTTVAPVSHVAPVSPSAPQKQFIPSYVPTAKRSNEVSAFTPTTSVGPSPHSPISYPPERPDRPERRAAIFPRHSGTFSSGTTTKPIPPPRRSGNAISSPQGQSHYPTPPISLRPLAPQTPAPQRIPTPPPLPPPGYMATAVKNASSEWTGTLRPSRSKREGVRQASGSGGTLTIGVKTSGAGLFNIERLMGEIDNIQTTNIPLTELNKVLNDIEYIRGVILKEIANRYRNNPSEAPVKLNEEVDNNMNNNNKVTLHEDMIAVSRGRAQFLTFKPVCTLNATISLTSIRILITDPDDQFNSSHGIMATAGPGMYTSIPLYTISKCEKLKKDKGIEITCKDYRVVRITFDGTQNSTWYNTFYENIVKFAFPAVMNDLHCFRNKITFSVDGWNLYCPIATYKRIGIPNARWRICTANDEYKMCATYPRVLIVPSSVTDNQMRVVASFRSKGRVPVLTWLHPKTGASIIRCSQPRVGLTRTRCFEDEGLFKAIRATNPESQTLYILDARPRVNAVANAAMGAGYELIDNYESTKLEFLGIENIHVMRDSLSKAIDVCLSETDDAKFMSAMESSHWLEHVALVMDSARRVAELICNGNSVVVHCSDGWDRTSQLVGISQLLLCPYSRTIEGFINVIEKDWLSFGHKFEQRVGGPPSGSGHNDSERSPIFVQYIDVVWQLTQQFPTYFEFNEKMLLTIIDNMFSCFFGTFLCNADKERAKAELHKNTTSLWSFILQYADDFRNPLYSPNANEIMPSPGLKNIQVWRGFLCRWNDLRNIFGRELDFASKKRLFDS